jgi:hypothetical protein
MTEDAVRRRACSYEGGSGLAGRTPTTARNQALAGGMGVFAAGEIIGTAAFLAQAQ